MILYIAGIGTVYITANFVVVSGASASNQGIAAGVFNVALQVGGSVLGLAVLTAIAQGINHKYGGASSSSSNAPLSEVAFQSVYYSCIILCAISLALSVFAVKVPESMRGSIWRKPEVKAAQSPELASAQVQSRDPHQGDDVELEQLSPQAPKKNSNEALAS